MIQHSTRFKGEDTDEFHVKMHFSETYARGHNSKMDTMKPGVGGIDG